MPKNITSLLESQSQFSVTRKITLRYQWVELNLHFEHTVLTGWERTGQMLCIVDTSLSVLMTLRMCLRELCCLFTVWI